MDQLLKVADIKNEPIELVTSDHMEISNEIQVESVKQESDCLVQSKLYVKTEPQEDESEFSIIAGTSCEICPKDSITDEPMIKIEREDLLDELMQDPLDTNSVIKVEISAFKSNDESSDKPEWIREKIEEECLSISNETKSHKRDTLNNQDHLYVQNKKIRKEKKYICPVCNKTSGRKQEMDRHLRIHTGEKPFTCNICDKSFNRKSTLDTHIFLHSGEKPYVCDVCKKVFSQKAYLDYHMLIHNGVKPFSCDECDKSFTQKQSLVVHKQIHTGDKPYTCDLCNKVFRHKSALTQHRRLHTGEKPYSCDVCNKLFARKSDLERHKKIHKK